MPGPKKDNNANMGGRQNGELPRSSVRSTRGSYGRFSGNRAGFQTDAAISNNRSGKERVLQRWVPDTDVPHHDSLEKPSGSGGKPWNQFAENEKLFGLTTDYDENIYTTAIDKNHPQYRERMAAAEKKAREIERSIASSSHVAEERVVDYIPGTGNSNENEEDKYVTIGCVMLGTNVNLLEQIQRSPPQRLPTPGGSREQIHASSEEGAGSSFYGQGSPD